MVSMVAALAAALNFAAPAVIVFGGGPMPRRVSLTDWPENLRLMQATHTPVQVPAESLRVRRRINVAMYWGSHWRTLNDRRSLPDTVSMFDRQQGAQDGAFYPAQRGRKPVWLFGGYGPTPSSARAITSAGLEILRKHGVPVSVP